MGSKGKDCLYVVMPAYNEEATILEVVEQWYKVLEDKSDDSGRVDRKLCRRACAMV
jgi:hypothetical protein